MNNIKIQTGILDAWGEPGIYFYEITVLINNNDEFCANILINEGSGDIKSTKLSLFYSLIEDCYDDEEVKAIFIQENVKQSDVIRAIKEAKKDLIKQYGNYYG